MEIEVRGSITDALSKEMNGGIDTVTITVGKNKFLIETLCHDEDSIVITKIASTMGHVVKIHPQSSNQIILK